MCLKSTIGKRKCLTYAFAELLMEKVEKAWPENQRYKKIDAEGCGAATVGLVDHRLVTESFIKANTNTGSGVVGPPQ